MDARSDLGRENLLRLVDLGILERFEPRAFLERKIGEEAQEPADILVLDIAPILPEVAGHSISPLSQTAPAAVLPIFAPDAVVSSGQVRP